MRSVITALRSGLTSKAKSVERRRLSEAEESSMSMVRLDIIINMQTNPNILSSSDDTTVKKKGKS